MSRPPRARRRPAGSWIGRLVLALLLLPVLAAGTIAGLVWWTLPGRDLTLTLRGLTAPVDVAFDRQGIPRILAANEYDAAMALGFLHARDRLFQMEMMRRGGQGRLSEIAGPATLRSDRMVRTLGLARRAKEDLAALPLTTRTMLEAYAAGVNAWIVARGRFAAPEFLALGQPEFWLPEHSLLWGKIMGVWLSGNWRLELDRARLATMLPAERLQELWPEDTTAGRPEVLASLDPGHLARLAAALPRFPEPGTLPGSASNAWAVTGARSASGAPLLANDPHLGFQAPILWYLARIDLADGRMLAGATAPGVPFMVIGRNERIAWGFTTTHSDTQDLFAERLAGADRYVTPDGPQPFRVTEEVIAIRGAEPETLRVRETRHGPVISDLDAAGGGAARPGAAVGGVLALAAANLAPGDTAAAGLHALNRARSLAEARGAAALITSPSQNLMVADAAGPIAMYLTGRTPVRRAGEGLLPAPGWDGAQDWAGWVAFDDLPHAENPASGALANANNRVVPPDSPVFLGRDWYADHRFRRIGEMLAARPLHDAAGFVRQQHDIRDLFAREALGPDSPLRRIPRPEGAVGVARDLLLAWDGEAAADRAEPLIFVAWTRRLGQMALAAGGVPDGAWTAQSEFLRLVLAPDGRGSAWCNGDCTALAARALAEAVAELSATFGPDPEAWRWGTLHRAAFEHPLLRGLPVLGGFFRLETATGGTEWTVGRGGMGAGRRGLDMAHVHGAGLRLVADLSDPDRTLAVIATGQSGHPLSRHWGDLLEAWRDGGTIALRRAADQVTARVRLAP